MSAISNNRFQVRLPLLLATVLALGMFIGLRLPRGMGVSFSPGTRATHTATGSIDEVFRYIDANYVDTVETARLRDEAISQLLAQLDPHSVYISPEELRAVEEDMSGHFEGIGVEFIVLDDTIQVVSPISGGPSEAVGIMAGDRIVAINDTTVAGVKTSLSKIYNRLRGPKGTEVNLGIRRGSENMLRQFTVVRDVIPVHSVDIAYMLDRETGYIKVNRFNAKTHQEFMGALTRLVDSSAMKHLVLDLRGNPGGYLNEAIDMLSQLFPEGKLLVYTQGRKEERRNYKSNGRARFDLQQVAVLIDEGSASASEIMAGAIQDHDRGWIVGRRSYGKGLVQEQYSLRNGAAIRLTVARYYTPSGRSIQRAYTSKEAYERDPEERLQNGELSGKSNIPVLDSTAYYTGKGRLVYAHGGIMPDVFVPIDTAYVNPYYIKLRQQLPQFVARWMEGQERSSFPATMEAFVQAWHPPAEMLQAMVDYAEREGRTPRDAGQMAACRDELSLQLKARVGRLLFQQEGYYAVLNSDDPAVDKALQLIRKGAFPGVQ